MRMALLSNSSRNTLFYQKRRFQYMLRNVLDHLRAKKALRNWAKSPVGQALRENTARFFYNNQLLSFCEDETKNKIIQGFHEKLFSIGNSKEPFLRMRELLAEYVWSYSSLQVLCLTETEKEKDDFYAKCPYISGALHREIQCAAKFNAVLGEFKSSLGEVSDDELVAYCNFQCSIYMYFYSNLNLLRAEFSDWNPHKDWMKPFVKSMLISAEDKIRSEMGLPRLLPDLDEGIKHDTFFNLVISGERNPYYQWNKAWAEDHLA
jgi:hypothetical protein